MQPHKLLEGHKSVGGVPISLVGLTVWHILADWCEGGRLSEADHQSYIGSVEVARRPSCTFPGLSRTGDIDLTTYAALLALPHCSSSPCRHSESWYFSLRKTWADELAGRPSINQRGALHGGLDLHQREVALELDGDQE